MHQKQKFLVGALMWLMVGVKYSGSFYNASEPHRSGNQIDSALMNQDHEHIESNWMYLLAM
jgi:hypothetical protein